MNAASLLPGFADPVAQSQAVFRALLDAMARPGQIAALSGLGLHEGPLSAAAAAVALTLADFETPVWLAPRVVDAAAWLRFHCGCPLTGNSCDARFAFVATDATLPALTTFNLGSDEFPDRSTTVIIEVANLTAVAGLRLSGPGILDTTALTIEGLDAPFWKQRAELEELFPRGIDIVLTCGHRLAALPRTTKVEI